MTLGEAMLVVRGSVPGRPVPGAPAELSFAGAESTVAIGVCRLGHTAAWLGRVGTDAAGDLILDALRGAGVDVTAATRDPDRPTGLLLRHRRTADRVVVDYYRDGLAGSRLVASHLPDGLIESARILHVTGITPALSPSAAEAVQEAIRRARAAGVTVSLDVNYRSRLWPADRAAPVLRALVEQADVVFAGAEEAALVLGTATTVYPPGTGPAGADRSRAGQSEGIGSVPAAGGAGIEHAPAGAPGAGDVPAGGWGSGHAPAGGGRTGRAPAGGARTDTTSAGGSAPRDPEELGAALRALGPGEAVIKLGAAGALTVTASGVWRSPAVPVTQVDPVGAGDAFVAGYLSGLLDGLTPAERLARAAGCGAVAVSTVGDWEGLASRADLAALTDADIQR